MKILNVKNFFLNLIRKPYYYVPPCPCCNSRMTGRFVKSHGYSRDEWVEKESLKHGELVTEKLIIPKKNAFCVECGFSWTCDVKIKFFSLSKIMEEAEARGTYEILSGIEEEKNIERDAEIRSLKIGKKIR